MDALPQDVLPLLDGCACLPRVAGASALLNAYFDACIDYSRGTEPRTMSMSTVVTITHQQQEVRFHSQLPEQLVQGTFRYDAGPWPAAFALQVCRAGEVTCGQGFGVSTLEPIRRGSYVCSYWGEYRTRFADKTPADDLKYVLFHHGRSGGTVLPSSLEHGPPQVVENESEDGEEESEYACPLCGFELNPDAEDPNDFCIDATSFGNVARWINHSKTVDNLEARLSRDPAAPPLPGGWPTFKVSFYATCDIDAGEMLCWDYVRPGRAIRKSAPTTAGIPDHWGVPELLRTLPEGALVRAEWELGGDDSSDSVLVEGYPPHAPADGAEDPWSDDNYGDWRGALENYEKSLQHLRELPPVPWEEHDDDAPPPRAPGDRERCAHWAVPCMWHMTTGSL